MKHSYATPRTDAEILDELEQRRKPTIENYGVNYQSGNHMLIAGLKSEAEVVARMDEYPAEAVYEYWLAREDEVLRKMGNIAIEVIKL